MGDYNSVKKYILDVATKTDGGVPVRTPASIVARTDGAR